MHYETLLMKNKKFKKTKKKNKWLSGWKVGVLRAGSCTWEGEKREE